RDLDALPFWASLRGRNKKVAVIDPPDCYPVPGVDGVQLANWAPHLGWASRDPVYAPCAEPTELLQEVRQLFGPRMNLLENSSSSFQEDEQIYQSLLKQIAKKGELCRKLLARDDRRHSYLIVAVFSECHTAAHQFWKYRPAVPASEATQENKLTHAIRDVYQAIDRQLGLLLIELPDDANVFIVSSVGIEDDYPTTQLIETFCRQLGYQAHPEPASPSLKPLALFRRIIPQAWRIALSRYLPRDTRERLLADQFRNGTNWGKTTAFTIPAYYTSFVRVNLRGREPEGIVERGAEYESLLERLESDLKQLVDLDTGEPAVKRITRSVDVFNGYPHVALPDLFIEWNHRHFMQRVNHPMCDLVQKKPDFFRTTDHSDHGFFAAAGPSIGARESLGDVPVLDFAPTFLSLMGEPVPRCLTGKVIDRMISD
nr:hypothetical protein [Pyrinomonadaceae bacterium]